MKILAISNSGNHRGNNIIWKVSLIYDNITIMDVALSLNDNFTYEKYDKNDKDCCPKWYYTEGVYDCRNNESIVWATDNYFTYDGISYVLIDIMDNESIFEFNNFEIYGNLYELLYNKIKEYNEEN